MRKNEKLLAKKLCITRLYNLSLQTWLLKIEAARLLCLKAAWEKDQNKDYTYSSSMAKVYSSETAMWTAIEAVQIHGGYGFVKEYHVERLMRDAKITQIYEGTSEVQRIVISRALLQ
ncbi:MAG: acyl-CoA dehydrogenase family protein [Segetibacter sp.]